MVYACDTEINEAARADYEWFKGQYGGPGSKVVLPSEEESVQRSLEDFNHKALAAAVEGRAGHCWLKLKH